MPYIDRDQAGNIVGIFANPQREGHEFVETAELWIPPPPIPVKIENIERSVSTTLQRGFREVLLTMMEREAAAMGITPAQLYATNVGYRRAKDIDNQIAALLAQMS
jgi:hypothetical protein